MLGPDAVPPADSSFTRSRLHATVLRGFDAAAEAYDEGRPEYPDGVREWLRTELGVSPASLVLDLAAGTGKTTRIVRSTGARSIALEPVRGMRRVFRTRYADVPLVAGAAEAIPLRPRSVNAVIVGQAFHWFRGPEALGEIHRVLRPNGALGLLWASRDPSVPWVARLNELIDTYDPGTVPRRRTGTWREVFDRAPGFSSLNRTTMQFVQEVSAPTVLARFASISYVATLGPAERERALDRVRELLARDPATSADRTFPFPHLLELYSCRALPESETPR